MVALPWNHRMIQGDEINTDITTGFVNTIRSDEPQYYYEADKLVYVVLPSIMMILSTLAVSLRMYVRIHIVKKVRLDDYLLIFGQICGIADTALWFAIRSIERHYVPDSPEMLKHTAALLLSGEALYMSYGSCIKVSAAILLLRIAQQPWQRHVYNAVIAFYSVFVVLWVLIVLFRCGDLNAVDIQTRTDCAVNWDGAIGPLAYLVASINALSDWVFACVPLYMVLRTARWNFSSWDRIRHKKSLAGLVFLAAAGSVISLVRLQSLDRLAFGVGSVRRSALPILLVTLEVGFGAMAISMLSMRPLQLSIRRFRDSLDILANKVSSRAKSVGSGPNDHDDKGGNGNGKLTSRIVVAVPEPAIIRGVGILPDTEMFASRIKWHGDEDLESGGDLTTVSSLTTSSSKRSIPSSSVVELQSLPPTTANASSAPPPQRKISNAAAMQLVTGLQSISEDKEI